MENSGYSGSNIMISLVCGKRDGQMGRRNVASNLSNHLYSGFENKGRGTM